MIAVDCWLVLGCDGIGVPNIHTLDSVHRESFFHYSFSYMKSNGLERSVFIMFGHAALFCQRRQMFRWMENTRARRLMLNVLFALIPSLVYCSLPTAINIIGRFELTLVNHATAIKLGLLLTVAPTMTTGIGYAVVDGLISTLVMRKKPATLLIKFVSSRITRALRLALMFTDIVRFQTDPLGTRFSALIRQKPRSQSLSRLRP